MHQDSLNKKKSVWILTTCDVVHRGYAALAAATSLTPEELDQGRFLLHALQLRSLHLASAGEGDGLLSKRLTYISACTISLLSLVYWFAIAILDCDTSQPEIYRLGQVGLPQHRFQT